MKYIKNVALLVVGLCVTTLFFIYLDLEEKRPIISLFKLFQSNSSLEVIDYALDETDKKKTPISSNKDRNAYYGDLHVHTKHSFDAYIFGVTASPDDAYNWAKGKTIKHPLGFDMKNDEPLDFYAVTDHGFFMGMMQAYADPSGKMSNYEFTKAFHNLNDPENVTVESAGQRSNILVQY